LRIFVYSPQFTHQALRLIHTSLHTAISRLPRCCDNYDILVCDITTWYPWLPDHNGYDSTWFVCDVTTWFRRRPGFLRYSRASSARGVTPRIRLGSWFPYLYDRASFASDVTSQTAIITKKKTYEFRGGLEWEGYVGFLPRPHREQTVL
jgi:hypothetical protein